MSEQVKVYTSSIVDINGWRFDFKCMKACQLRSARMVGIFYHEQTGSITYLNLNDRPQTTSNFGTWDWNKWFSFFTPPEDGYNRLIDEAYQTYLFEESLLS